MRALGNTVLMLREPIALAARDHLGAADVVLVDKLDPAAIDAVLLDVDAGAGAPRARGARRVAGRDRAHRRLRTRRRGATGCASSSSAR